MQGNAGPQGLTGAAGDEGKRGSTGEQGSTGPAGLRGPRVSNVLVFFSHIYESYMFNNFTYLLVSVIYSCQCFNDVYTFSV